jgi:AraC family transcriptional regulator, arabinose operon regulatory protein
MRYVANYSIADHDDMGVEDQTNYLQINSVGFYEFDEPFGAMHRKRGRRDWYLSYNHSGRMLVKCEGGMQVIEAGDAFLYAPHEEQLYGQENQQPFANYWVHFTGFGVQEILANAGLAERRQLRLGQDAALVELFERIIGEIEHKKRGYELVATSLLMQLIGSIGRHLEHDGAVGLHQQHIGPALERIHKHYDGKLVVSDLASLCHLSISRFYTLFHRHTGLSPQQYIIDLRLRKACELMRHTHLNIRQISSLCGFEDQLYFSKLFKKHMAATPSDWQKASVLNLPL